MRARGWLLWFVAVFGPPTALLVGLERYPLVHQASPAFWSMTATGALLGLAVAVTLRRRLFPWRHEHPATMVGTVLGIGMLTGFAAAAAYLWINGGLDPSVSERVTLEVRTVLRDRDVVLANPGGEDVRVDVPRRSATAVSPGDSVHLVIRPGRLGGPWIVDWQPVTE